MNNMMEDYIRSVVVKRSGELNPDKIKWNKITRSLVCEDNNLVVDFSELFSCSINVGHNCTILAGEKSDIICDQDCTVNVGRDSTVMARHNSSITTEDNCRILTRQGCTINTGDNCEIITDGDCIINTGENCVILPSEEAEDEIITMISYAVHRKLHRED